MKFKLVVLALLLILVLPTFVSAQPPPFQAGEAGVGLTLRSPFSQITKQNQGINFHLHVFNATDNAPIVTGISCQGHIYNTSGEESTYALFVDTVDATGFDYIFEIDAGNFSDIGRHGAVIWCNGSANSKTFGFESFGFDVTPTGQEFTEQQAKIYNLSIIIIFILFCLSLWGAIVIPWKNETDAEGKIVNIQDIKYFKILLWGVAYLLLTYLFSVLHDITASYLFLGSIAGIFKVLYFIMLAGVLPLTIVLPAIALILFLQDKRIRAMIERGLIPHK